ncbi:unnamed protein product [Brassicogethes aeneus]|uniref:Uncharacterized protein n=1 Tax=Brassicogethes aeneus TaxID=1431903 RepID=A0A9P0FPC2_BRAAE|nr:unnamed protein product [Brassicogethes aeneus]
MFNHKIVVVGDGACGKTCLLISFTKNDFNEDYVPTIYEIQSKEIKVGDKDCFLRLWDTAGEEDYDRLRPLSYPGTDLILMCYNIENPDSLVNVYMKWAPEVKHFLPNKPIILVGNKLDLRSDPEVITSLLKHGKKPVTNKEGYKVAKKIGAINFYECSAKTMFNVREIFNYAAEYLMFQTPRAINKRVCEIL